MRNLFVIAFSALVASCSSVMSDLASFKDPSFNEREPAKTLALIVNNASMQNVNRMQLSFKEALKNENVDVVLLDHYTVNPPTRKLSEKDLSNDLKNKWKADSVLYIDVISEFAKDKNGQDSIDLSNVLLKKDDLYKTTAYGKYSARLFDVQSWTMIWKADLISIDEKFANSKKMYDETSEKIVADLLNKKLLIKFGKRKSTDVKNNDKNQNVELLNESYNDTLNSVSMAKSKIAPVEDNPAQRKVVSYDDLSEDDLLAAEENMNRVANGMPAKMPSSSSDDKLNKTSAPVAPRAGAVKDNSPVPVSRAGAVKQNITNAPVQGRVINPKDMEVPSDVSVRPISSVPAVNTNSLVRAVPKEDIAIKNGQAMIEKKSSVVSDNSASSKPAAPVKSADKIIPADVNKPAVSASIEDGSIF